MASWLVARWFLGGELVGGEIPWWRGNRIPILHFDSTANSKVRRRKNIRIREKIVYTTQLSGFKSFRIQSPDSKSLET